MSIRIGAMSKVDQLDFAKQLPMRGEYDVIVAGGGVAGYAAALSAARCGKKVLLTEKTVILGGLATTGLINFFVPMCNGRGRQIIFGMAEEMLRDSVKYGYDTIPDEWKNGEPGESEDVPRYVTRYSPYLFALQMTEALHHAGVEILFDCAVVEPVMEGGHCKGVITSSKAGLEFRRGKIIVDTTGDADVLRRSGMPTVIGKNYFTYLGRIVTLDSCRSALETGRAETAVQTITGGNIDLYGHNQPEDVPLFHGTTPEDVSDYIIRNQLIMLGKMKDKDRLAGEISTLPAMPQFRTTCHIAGDYTLKTDDAYRHFDDSIAAINDFDRPDNLYEVPYRTLIRSGFDNLITAGRSASAEGYAWDVLRVIPPAIITGQAAGEAAALAIDSGRSITGIDVPTLQRRLESRNVMIHFEDSLVP